ncbi:MAG: hypothetical protein A4E48_01496 [Methanosaeta sp. PtaU1.Bin060]|nr:MAG: hypothetical protein A4E48_01496 [Methanosaeta sp. PtaU1.Bin060]
MANGSSSYLSPAIILVAVLVVVFMAVFLAGTNRSEFENPMDISAFEQALHDEGLQTCIQGDVNWMTTPGFVRGLFYDISTNCSTFDPNRPEARVWVLEFSNIEARDAAVRNFETSRRHIGSAIVWVKGSMVILVDGSQRTEVVSALREAMASIEA